MNNNLRRFDRFSGQAKFAVPNHLRHAGYDRLTMATVPWQGATVISKPEEKTNIDQLWATAEQNIVNEQAIKEVQKDLVNRETARMIYRLNQRDNARNPLLYPNFKTEIQGVYGVPHQANEPTDSYEAETKVNDDNIYAANALPYVQGSVRLGTWSGGNPSQYVTFASASPYRGGRRYDSDVIPAPLVGIDNVEGYEEYLWQFVKSHRSEIEMAVKAAVNTVQAQAPFDIFQFVMTKVPMTPNGKAFMITALFILALCQCAQTASQKKQLNVCLYMAKHNCSQEEAEAHISYFDLLIAEVGAVVTEAWVAKTLQIWGIPKQIAEKLTYLCFAVLKMFDEYRRILQKELYYL